MAIGSSLRFRPARGPGDSPARPGPAQRHRWKTQV